MTERVLYFVSQNSLQVFPHTGHRCNVGALVGGVDVQQVRTEGDAVQPFDLAREDTAFQARMNGNDLGLCTVLCLVHSYAAVALGGSVRFHGDYPAWTYARESALRDRCVAMYEAQYGAKPQIVAIHAGLECGILSGKIDGLDCISFGPNLLHVHTPNERADIASVARVWEYLKAILAYKE